MFRSRNFSWLLFILGFLMGGFIIKVAIHVTFNTNTCYIDSTMTDDQMDIVLYDNSSEKDFPLKTQLLYVGVMTAEKFLGSRAKAVYETWGKNLPGKIGFFSSETSTTKEKIPLISLKGIDDSYPPQKKSLTMLKYMYDNFLNDFEFFMRTDDDVYVKPERLSPLLSSINSSKLYFIGQMGTGLKDEIGKLFLDSGENYCMGGPGIIFSRATLAAIGPYIDECISNLKTYHEDVEVGRCVQKFAGIPCTWSFEMQMAFYHNTNNGANFEKLLRSTEFHQAITIHPIKNPEYMYALHSHNQAQRIKEEELLLLQIIREMSQLSELYSLSLPNLDDPQGGIFVNHLGSLPTLQKFDVTQDVDVPVWDFFQKYYYSYNNINVRQTEYPYNKEAVEDTIREIMEYVNSLSEERSRTITFKNRLYDYLRYSRYGAEFILDMLWSYKKNKRRSRSLISHVRRHAYVQVPFGPLYTQEADSNGIDKRHQSSYNTFLDSINIGMKEMSKLSPRYNSPNSASGEDNQKMVTVILTLSGRLDRFQLFLDNFRLICVEGMSRAKLVVVHFRGVIGEEDTSAKVEKEVNNFLQMHPSALIEVLKVNKPFSRGVGLTIGADATQPSDLLFFVDVDMKFDRLALERVRMHTIQGYQVYFPIVYSEFNYKYLPEDQTDPTRDHSQISEVGGFWRSTGYGMASIYTSDLITVGGMNTTIVGWGKEDVDLFEKVLKSPLHVFRAAEPGLVHVFHPVMCDSILDTGIHGQYDNCMGSSRNVMGHRTSLAAYIDEKPEILVYKQAHND